MFWSIEEFAIKNGDDGEFPVVRTWPFLCQGPDLIPSGRTKVPQAMWHGQKKKNIYIYIYIYIYGNDGKICMYFEVWKVILADTWSNLNFTDQSSLFMVFRTCIVHLPWPSRRGVHLKVKNGIAVVQTSKVQLGTTVCDFRLMPILLRTWISRVMSCLGCYQLFSKQYLLVDGRCNLMTSRSPLETLGEKGDMCSGQ